MRLVPEPVINTSTTVRKQFGYRTNALWDRTLALLVGRVAGCTALRSASGKRELQSSQSLIEQASRLTHRPRPRLPPKAHALPPRARHQVHFEHVADCTGHSSGLGFRAPSMRDSSKHSPSKHTHRHCLHCRQ